jgi:putative hydrolase of the HAD superfamily
MAVNNKITDIFFDLDHTLWDFDKNSALAFERVFQAHGISIKLTEFIKVYEPINFGYWKLYREDKVSKLELRRGRFREAFKPFGILYAEEELDKLASSYIEELPKDNHLLDGATDVLQYLYGRYQLHIITNGFAEVQALKLKNSNISQYFHTVTTSEEVGLKKPHPVIFKTALEKASVLPQKSIMIGDTFEADIMGAEKVGMHTLFFNYRQDEVPASYLVVNRLREIKSHL